MISPGDVIVADDDCVWVVRREDNPGVVAAAEQEKRALYAQGT